MVLSFWLFAKLLILTYFSRFLVNFNLLHLIMNINRTKSRKIPYLWWQSDARKLHAIRAVNKSLTQTTTLCPVNLVSKGISSLGTIQEGHKINQIDKSQWQGKRQFPPEGSLPVQRDIYYNYSSDFGSSYNSRDSCN